MKKHLTICDLCGKPITPDDNQENLNKSNGWHIEVPQGSPDNKLDSITLMKFEHLHHNCSVKLFDLFRTAINNVALKWCAKEYLIQEKLIKKPK